MPDVFFSSKEEAPEGLRELLVADGEKFKINVVPKVKLDEFRENNTSLLQERDTLKATVEKIAPLAGEDLDAFVSEVGELRGVKQQVEDGKLTAKDDIEKAVSSRVSEMEKDYQTQLREMGVKVQNLTEYGQNMSQKYQGSVRDREITNAVLAPESGVNPQTLPDVLRRAEGTFHVQEDGSLVPKKGDTVIYGSDGATPMAPNEWLGKLLEEAPYLGKTSAGGGATGERGDAKFGGMEEKAFMELTPQKRMEIARQKA